MQLLAWLTSLMSLCLGTASSCELQIECSRATIREQDFAAIVLNISQPHDDRPRSASAAVSMTIASTNVAQIVNISGPIDSLTGRISLENTLLQQFTVTVQGKFLGKTAIYFDVARGNNNETDRCPQQCPVDVVRREQLFQRIFAIVMGGVVFCNTFIMGMQLNWKVMLETIKHPLPLLVGIGVQYSVQPALAYGWSQLLLADSVPYQLAYFAVGCAPGGGSANFWTILLGGNVDLSVTLSVVANVVALGLMPLWLLTLGKHIVRATNIKIPFENILVSLALLVVPVTLGMLLSKYKPKAQSFSRKVIKYTSLAVIVFAASIGSYANYYIFMLFTWRTILCGLLLPWGGYLFGYIAATLFCQNYENRIAIALGTGIQKTGISILLLLFSLDQPDADLSMVLPVSVIMMVPWPPALLLLVRTILGFRKVRLDSAKAPETKATDEGQKGSVCCFKGLSCITGSEQEPSEPKEKAKSTAI